VRLSTRGEAGELLQKFEMELGEYRDGIPWIGRAVSWVRSPAGSGAAGGLKLIYRRESLAHLADEPAAPPIRNGDWIADSRIGAAYELGRTVGEVGGLRTEFSEPILDWIGLPERLPSLVGKSKGTQLGAFAANRALLLWIAVGVFGPMVIAHFVGRSRRAGVAWTRLIAVGGASGACIY